MNQMCKSKWFKPPGGLFNNFKFTVFSEQNAASVCVKLIKYTRQTVTYSLYFLEDV